jgi:hypothetical protein
MEQITLWAAAIFAGIWTINWIICAGMSRGHFWSIVEITAMWATVGVFIRHPDISRFHLIWAFPLAFIAGFMLSGIPFMGSRAIRRRNTRG